MADLRKFLDQAGLATLWGKIKDADAALAAKIGTVPEDQTVMDIITNIQENAYDDTALKAEINAELAKKADQTDLDAVSAVANAAVKQSDYDAKIADLEAADVALDGRLDKVEAFFDPKDSEGNPVDIDAALDTLVEIQEYINTHGEAAEQIIKDVAQNKADIATKADAATVNSALDGKVDKVEGKGLSTNDLTNELKAQYDAAQANVIETVKVNGTALTPDENKAVDITVPTGALASKDKVAEADLATELATKLNGKANTADLGALASKNTVATADIEDDAVTFDKLANDVEVMLISSLRSVGVRNDENGNHIFYTLTNYASEADKKDFWTVPVLTTAEIEAICV